ncbi:MAG TPA: hypothetical protein EYP49_08775 [Anaerolineae bacterium]|nr:hypothetical protein [Anaerolineae bacterium]
MILSDKLRILRLISEQPFEEQEAEVLRRLCQEGGLYTERLIERLGLSQIVLLLSHWHARFRKSLSPAPPWERGLEPRPTVLCAFTSVLDRVVDQAGLNRLLPWAAEVMGLSPDDLLNRAAQRAQSGRNSRGESLSALVHDPLDVVAALLYFFRHPPALKPAIGNLTLRHQLEAFLAELPPGQLRQVLGGASAVAADILAELGVEARFYTMYHSPAQAQRHGPLARRLDLGSGQIVYQPAQKTGTYRPVVSPSALGIGNWELGIDFFNHPTASSIAFVYQAGFTLGNVQAEQADGVIFRRAPRGERPWDRIRLHPVRGQSVALSAPEAEDEWLWLPGFVRWWVEGDTLHLAFADENTVRRIAADHHYLILSGLSPTTFAPGEGPRPEPCGEPVEPLVEGLAAGSLAAQIRSLAEDGATLHLELGGAAPEETIAPLAEALRGLVSSAGINDSELALLTSLSDFRVPVSDNEPHRSAVFQRYQRAVALAQRLGLQRLYVHGNDVDLILRQNGSPEAMRREIEADLFAKGVVVLAILQRSLEDWPSHAIQLAPVLLWKGFQALIAFAWDLVDQQGQAGQIDKLSYFKELIESGYTLADSPKGYAVAVVPVMWPALPPGIYPGGAGDICSSVSLVYAGF